MLGRKIDKAVNMGHKNLTFCLYLNYLSNGNNTPSHNLSNLMNLNILELNL